MSAFIRVARILAPVLLAACCNGAFADPVTEGISPAAIASPGKMLNAGLKSNAHWEISVGPKLALLTPSPTDLGEAQPDALPEPFNLPSWPALPSVVTTKWKELQSRIREDDKTLAACRSKKGRCSLAARRLLAIVKLGRSRHGLARLGWINRAVNLSIRPVSDRAQYGVNDYWASPLTTMRSSAGDCEDYAIVKYEALRYVGIDPDDLRLVIVHDVKEQANHAVLAVRQQNEWLILDNRTLIMARAGQARQYYPLFILDAQGVRTSVTAAASR